MSDPRDGEAVAVRGSASRPYVLKLGRKQFQRAVSIVRRQDQTDLWQEIAFLVFDAPALVEPFEERLHCVAELLRQHRPPFAKVHEHVRCRGRAHLEEELARVEQDEHHVRPLRVPCRDRRGRGAEPSEAAGTQENDGAHVLTPCRGYGSEVELRP